MLCKETAKFVKFIAREIFTLYSIGNEETLSLHTNDDHGIISESLRETLYLVSLQMRHVSLENSTDNQKYL